MHGQAQSVFILDEVQTSRLAPGGLQSTIFSPADGDDGDEDNRRPLRPTLTTLGKWLGGGLPFGAFGGAPEVMAVYDPRRGPARSMAHSGTFQNNTLMLRAGRAALADVYTPARATEHSARGDTFRARLRAASGATAAAGGSRRTGTRTRIAWTGLGSLVCLHVSERWGRSADGIGIGKKGDGGTVIRCKEDAGPEDEDVKTLFWLYMLERGFWVQRRGNIALSLDIPQEALDRFVEAVAEFVRDHEVAVRLDDPENHSLDGSGGD